MTEVSSATRFHTLSWWGSALGLGILLGALGYHFLVMPKFDNIQSQLNVIQRQTAPRAAPQLSSGSSSEDAANKSSPQVLKSKAAIPPRTNPHYVSAPRLTVTPA